MTQAIDESKEVGERISELRWKIEPPSAGLRRPGEGEVSPGSRASLGRRLVLVGLALVGMVLTAELLRSVLPTSYPPWVGEKLAWYDAHRDQVDTLFVGSSRVYRQIPPDYFDEQMAERGEEAYSFNMGLPSMKLPEMHFLLCRMLDPTRPNPRRVFAAVESRTLTHVIEEENEGSPRVIYWHDLASTVFAIQLLWEHNERSHANLTQKELWLATLAHGRSFLLRQFNISQAATAIGEIVVRPTAKDRSILIEVAHGRGFSRLEESGGLLKRRRRLLREAEDWKGRVERKASLYRRWQKEATASPEVADALNRMAEPIREVGSDVILFVAPNPSEDSRWMEGIATLESFDAVLIYDDPNTNPELYEYGNYFDFSHLNAKGARFFTSLLVRDYVMWKRGFTGTGPGAEAP